MCDKVKSTFGFARPENREESLTLYDRNETAFPAHAKTPWLTSYVISDFAIK